MRKILVVDDEENIRWIFSQALGKKDCEVHTAESGEDALQMIRDESYLMVFSDIYMDGMSGLDLLEQVKSVAPGLKIVMMTAQDTMNNTIEAMRRGAFDYISKPFDFEEIYRLVDRVIESTAIPEPEFPQAEADFSLEQIVGRSKQMQEVFKTIGKSAPSDLSVLITGESGTGKELVARAIHFYSQRVDHPFVAINCAAIARELLESELFGHEKGAFTGAVESKVGKFEMANDGTLLLDEIGDMEPALQAKILRVLQNHEFYRLGGKRSLRVNVRIIAATNQHLETLMQEKKFREDLFHRLNVIHIELPPLRERREDILLLAHHFLAQNAEELASGPVYLSPEVERMFEGYSWPGNIRELENVIKRGLVLVSQGPILPSHLSPQIQREMQGQAASPCDDWEDRLNALIKDYLRTHPNWENEDDLHDRLIQLLEKHLFQTVLDKFSGKQVASAKALGINRNTLKRKIDALSLSLKNNAATEEDREP